MAGYSKAIILGNLVRDPELKYTPQNKPLVNMTVAINTIPAKGKQVTTYMDVTAWDKQALACDEHLSKGSCVLVDGRLTQESWEDKQTGQKRNKIKITVNEIQFIPSPERKERKPRDTNNTDSGFDQDDVPF